MKSKFSQELLLEVNNLQEIQMVHFIENLIANGKSFHQRAINYELVDIDFSKFAHEHGIVYQENKHRYGGTFSCMITDSVFVKCQTHTSHITIDFTGIPSEVDRFVELFDCIMNRSGPMIRWVYDEHNSTADIPLKSRPLIKSAYPFIEGDVQSFIKEYLNSDASILLLIGPPGTGKSSLIKEIIRVSEKNAHVTYDPKIMQNESLFTEFITSSSMFLIMEDADAFLESRQDGNTMMHRFLNVGDGLVSTKGKKIIFSTNLPNVSDIDPALLRPGRCFDIVESRALTPEEAKIVLEEIGSTITPPNYDVTLAELTNTLRHHSKESRKIGFF